jgi:hypothetical protein
MKTEPGSKPHKKGAIGAKAEPVSSYAVPTMVKQEVLRIVQGTDDSTDGGPGYGGN